MNKNELVERYKKLYAGVIYDTLTFDLKVRKNFLVDMSVKPCYPFRDVLFGPAFTCKGEKVQDVEHIDDTIRLKMFQRFYEGCVQVISSGGYRDVAEFGDISGKIARKFGAVGAVVDAPTRDVRLIEDDGFKLFCMGAQCTDAYGKWQITEYEVPIIYPGIHGVVEINPGDFIFGDPDGILVIQKDIVYDVLSGAEKRLEKENIVREEIYRTNDIVDLNNRVGRW
ncbi:MAG: RraA family protein [Alphaproteobacteria bacterium]|nr:RraA family protein [Alphaproteobacteria bacterium]